MEKNLVKEDELKETEVGNSMKENDSSIEEGDKKNGPRDDKEIPIVDHIGELIKRLAVIVGVAGLVSVITFPFADTAINFLWDSILPVSEVTRPRLYGILELKFTEFKVASLVGLIIALPVCVYELYAFMRPGLYEHERRYYLAAIPTSLVLALVGVSFAYFVVLPTVFTYFLYYSEGIATVGFGLGQTFNLILVLIGYLAVVFQIPLFVMLAILMGIVTRKWLAKRRILFWGGFLGISFIFSPDPTGMAPLIVASTMVILFEGTLLAARWMGRE
jgi:sec-independent protein translocase protein TatC